MRRILTRQDYLKDINSKHYSKYTGINEEVFANDANWGDTLVGRLINSLARKAKISFNQSRMSRLVNQLKEYFDMMLETGKFDITDSSVFTFIEISNIIGILKKQVEDGEEVNTLIQTTENLIIKVNSYDFDNKDEMIRLLKEFLEYLKGLKTESSADESGESGETKDPNVLFLEYSKNFLQSVVDLHNMIRDNVVRIGGGKESYDNKIISAKSKLEVGKEYMYINTEGVEKKCLLVSKTNVVTKEKDKKWLTEDDREGEPLNKDQVFVVYKTKDDYNKTGSGNSVEVLKIYNLGGKAPGSKVEKPGEDVSTYFNKEKYLNLEKTYQSGKKIDVLKNLIKMSQNAVKVHQAKNDQQSVKFYTDKLNKQVLDLVKKQAQSYGISLQIEKEIKVGDKIVKKPTGQFKDSKTLKEEITKVSKQKWSVDLPFGKLTGVKSSEKSPKLNVGKTEKQNASYYFLYEEVEANLQKDEAQAKNAWKKVVKAYNDSGISKFIPQIEELLSIRSKDGKEKLKQSNKDIITICRQVVMNKPTTGKPISFEELIKEAVNVNDAAKSISLFGRILLAFKEDMGLTGSYGSAIKPLKEFINKFSELEKLLPSLPKNERISNYSKFLLIRERNEFSDQIKTKFDELFTEDVIKYFEVTEEKRTEIENSVKEPEGYEFIFDSADYIIEIVRAFNRAYRIHTPGTIPSGRTNGKVSNKVFREYEYLGSGSGGSADNPGAGPYRNKELFTTWSEGVNDILSDTKYRPLFSDSAVFRFSQGGDDIEKGGKILMSFITRLLHDQEMYRSGVMSKFISEYFGIPVDFSDKKGLESRKSDAEKNSLAADEVEIFKFEILPIGKTPFNKLEKVLENTNKNIKFKFNIKDGDKDKTYYSIFKEKRNNGDIICILTTKNFPFDITRISIKDNNNAPENPVFVKFKISGNKIEGNKLEFSDSNSISTKTQSIDWTFSDSEVGILCDSEKEPYLKDIKIYSKFRDFEDQYEKIKNRI
jgi:glycerophosphoryl diester phosphodiesterase